LPGEKGREKKSSLPPWEGVAAEARGSKSPRKEGKNQRKTPLYEGRKEEGHAPAQQGRKAFQSQTSKSARGQVKRDLKANPINPYYYSIRETKEGTAQSRTRTARRI